MAEACNIGLEPLIKHNIPALTRHRLSWVKQNYLRAETLVSANAHWLIFSPHWSLLVVGEVEKWHQLTACALSHQ